MSDHNPLREEREAMEKARRTVTLTLTYDDLRWHHEDARRAMEREAIRVSNTELGRAAYRSGWLGAKKFYAGAASPGGEEADGMVRVFIDNEGYYVRPDVAGEFLISLRHRPCEEWAVWQEAQPEDVDAGWLRPLALKGGERFYTTPKHITAGRPAGGEEREAREDRFRVALEEIAGEDIGCDDENQVIARAALADSTKGDDDER